MELCMVMNLRLSMEDLLPVVGLTSLVKGEIVMRLMMLLQGHSLCVNLLVLVQQLLLMALLLLQLLLSHSALLLLLLSVTWVVVLLLCLLWLDMKLLVVKLRLLMAKLSLLLRKRVVHSPILVMVSPHRAAAVTEQPIGLRHLAHGGTVVLAMLLCNHATTCARRTRKYLPHGILCLHANVMTHWLTVTGHGLLSRNRWHQVWLLPRAKRLHLEGFKVSAEV